MTDRPITFQETRASPVELWAYHAGMLREARKSAQNLLMELRQEYPKAKVWLSVERIALPEIADVLADLD